MAKTARILIADALADIREEDLEKFRMMILEKREGPRIRRAQVEKKGYLELSSVLADAYTGYRAIKVTEELLRAINCNRVADELVEEAEELQEAASHSRGASGGLPVQQQHFVDIHFTELVKRVTNIDPILDELLAKRVLNQEQYDEIRGLSTCQNKMRDLFSKILKTSKIKDIFLSTLENEEPYLIEDLRDRQA